MQSISTGAAADELVKNGLMDFAAENFEIACYKALLIAAEAYGDDHIAMVCQEILEDEMEMARWLDQNLPMVVLDTFQERVGAH
jgi:ferritin-like metal-binding protein YciE